MTQIILPHTYQPQETGWWCGPAATKIALSAKGIHISQRDVMLEIEALEGNQGWDDQDGTDYIGQITTILNRKTGLPYVTTNIPNDPPTQGQINKLWDDIVGSIDAGNAVVANIVAPPGNTNPPMYPDNQTIWHYICITGWKDEGNGRFAWISDSANFGGIGEYWLGVELLAINIASKGYTACPGAPVATPPPYVERTTWDAVLEQFVGPKG